MIDKKRPKKHKIMGWSDYYGRPILKKERRILDNIVVENAREIRNLINSGVLSHFNLALKHCDYGKTEQAHLLREYAQSVISTVKWVKELKEERKKQENYLERLASDIKRVGGAKTSKKSAEHFIDLLRVKRHIAKYHSNLRLAKKTDYGVYMLIFYLDRLFDVQGLNYKKRQELIAGVIIFSELSSAFCYEEKREKDFLKYCPETIENGVIKIKKISNPIKKNVLHKGCNEFLQGNCCASLCCESKGCPREEQNIAKRLSRCRELFGRELASKECNATT